MSKRRGAVGALLLASALIAAACGDDDGAEAIAVTSTTKAPATAEALPLSEYVAEVNSLCSSTVEAIDGALVPVIEAYIGTLDAATADEQSLTDEQVMGLYATTQPVASDLNEEFSAMLSEIRALPASDSDASAFAEHWDRAEALWLEAYEAIVTASSDPVAARALLAEPDPRLAPTNEAAVTLGIEQCVFD